MTDLKPPENRDELLGAVLTLVDEVKILNEKLALYAPRDEVKRNLRLGIFRALALGFVVLLLSQAMTMTTISACFLNATGNAPKACGMMPGYSSAIQQNNIRFERFSLLLEGLEGTNNKVDGNSSKLEDIDKRLRALEKKGTGK